MIKTLSICIAYILLCVGCARETLPSTPTIEPSILPIDEETPTIIPSPSNDVLVTPLIEPSNENGINEIAEYLYQAVGIDIYLGDSAPSNLIVGKNKLVDIYSCPWILYEKNYGMEYYFIFYETVGTIDYLSFIKEAYVMFIIEYSAETKRSSQSLVRRYFGNNAEELKDVMAYHASNADNIEYIGQTSIDFSYSGKPEYMYKFLFMDEVLTILGNEIEGEFTVYEGPVNISTEFEAVKLCIDINGVKYSSFVCGEYSLIDTTDVIDYGKKYGFNNSIYFIAEDEEGNSCIYSPPIDSSDEEYIRKIVEFGRKTVVHNTPS